MVYCVECKREYCAKSWSRHLRTAVHQRNLARVNPYGAVVEQPMASVNIARRMPAELEQELMSAVSRREKRQSLELAQQARIQSYSNMSDISELYNQRDTHITRVDGPATHAVMFDNDAPNVEEFFNITEFDIRNEVRKYFVHPHSKLCITAQLKFILRDRQTKTEKIHWSGAGKKFWCYSLSSIDLLAPKL